MDNLSFEEILSKHGQIVKTPTGCSMRPMLKNKEDHVVIESICAPLRVNDVVLFKRDNGQYVLHRIIKIRQNDFVIRGDNCIENEYGITENQIIGKLKGFFKGNHYIDCDKSIIYKLYVLIWRITFFPRAFIIRLFVLLKNKT